MFNYKKIFSKRESRLKILSLLDFVPDKLMLKLQYFIFFKKRLNLSNPKSFTEKIQYYKLNYKDKELNEYIDKYEVRNVISKLNTDVNIPKLYSLSNSIKEIDWHVVPEKFIIKSTNGAGGQNVIICKNKYKVNFQTLTEHFSNLELIGKSPGRERQYEKIKPRLIVEELLEEDGIEGIKDFKFLCFHGEPKYVIVDYNRFSNHERNIYDLAWNNIRVSTDKNIFNSVTYPPKNFDKMIEIARNLSQDFPFVRIDLYNIDGKIYFGEFTFFPWSGYVNFEPKSFDYHLGDLFSVEEF